MLNSIFRSAVFDMLVFQYRNKVFHGSEWVFWGEFFYAERNVLKLQYATSERDEKTNNWIMSWIKFSQGFATTV